MKTRGKILYFFFGVVVVPLVLSLILPRIYVVPPKFISKKQWGYFLEVSPKDSVEKIYLATGFDQAGYYPLKKGERFLIVQWRPKDAEDRILKWWGKEFEPIGEYRYPNGKTVSLMYRVPKDFLNHLIKKVALTTDKYERKEREFQKSF